jgi:hypothetical protein
MEKIIITLIILLLNSISFAVTANIVNDENGNTIMVDANYNKIIYERGNTITTYSNGNIIMNKDGYHTLVHIDDYGNYVDNGYYVIEESDGTILKRYSKKTLVRINNNIKGIDTDELYLATEDENYMTAGGYIVDRVYINVAIVNNINEDMILKIKLKIIADTGDIINTYTKIIHSYKFTQNNVVSFVIDNNWGQHWDGTTIKIIKENKND